MSRTPITGHLMVDTVGSAMADNPESARQLPRGVRGFAYDPDLEQLFQEAINHHGVGRLADAERLYRQVLKLQPDHAGALSMIALVASIAGKSDAALLLAKRAVALNPAAGRWRGNLALVLAKAGRLSEAEVENRRALELTPHLFELHNNLANILRQQGRLPEAADAYRAALRLNPDHAHTHFNLGKTLEQQHLLEEAIEAYADAARVADSVPIFHRYLANAMRRTGNLEAAEAAYRKCLNLSPDDADARLQLGTVLLQCGDFARGWQEYESRLHAPHFPVRKGFVEPLWDGSPLHGQSIRLHVEQGYGDAIQFVRYAQSVKECGGRVFLQCPRALNRLFLTQSGIQRVFCDDEPMGPFDVHCPLLSLPHRLHTTPHTIPDQTPYLRADPTLVREWQQRLATRPGSKIGIAWAGNAKHLDDAYRSIPLRQFSPLIVVPGIRWISLQKERMDGEQSTPPPGMLIEHYTNALTDFAQTAALVSQLDLVISVDTAVAHLSGALGHRTWVLLAKPSEWRWGATGSKSPWYPTIRLFRQMRSGDWEPVLESVAKEIMRIKWAIQGSNL